MPSRKRKADRRHHGCREAGNQVSYAGYVNLADILLTVPWSGARLAIFAIRLPLKGGAGVPDVDSNMPRNDEFGVFIGRTATPRQATPWW